MTVCEVDARPGNAISLALSVQAPICVAPEVLTRSRLSPEGALPEAEVPYQSFMNTCKDPEIE